MTTRRKGKGSKALIGRWRIEEMDLWDRDALDLVGPAFIEFRLDQTGRFGFIAVEGWMDCREAAIDDRPGLEFHGTATTNAIRPAVEGGLLFARTAPSQDTSTSTWATTQPLGPSESHSLLSPGRHEGGCICLGKPARLS
jgi:hypothetical protein